MNHLRFVFPPTGCGEVLKRYLFLGVSSIARKVNNIRICWWPRSPSFFMVYEGWKAPLRIARRRTWSSWRVESFHGSKVYKLQDVGRIACCSCFFEDPNMMQHFCDWELPWAKGSLHAAARHRSLCSRLLVASTYHALAAFVLGGVDTAPRQQSIQRR